MTGALPYRPEIDGLRAIAVLAVVIYHAVPEALPGGFIGVDVFFVISGYLITSILAAEHAATGRIDLADFYARRVRRLFPALLAVLAFVLAASVLVLGPRAVPLHPIAESTQASLLFVANFHFLTVAGDYFADPHQPLLHLWSLAVEEQFYLLFPLLMLLRRRALVIGAAALGSLWLAEAWPRDQAFYMMPARFWELAAGALIALSPARGRTLLSVGVAMVVAAAFLTPQEGFPGLAAAPAVVGAALVVLAVHRGARSALLGSRAMVAIGLLSYGWYLWHWPLLAIDAATRIEPASTPWRLTLCVIALGLAWLSLRYVERPVRRATLPPVLWFFGTGVVVSAFAGTAMWIGGLTLLPKDVQALALATRRDWPAHVQTCHYVKGSVPEGLQCFDAPKLVIWGDSHAAAWQPAAFAMAKDRGIEAAAVTMGGCAPVDAPGLAEGCRHLNAVALEAMAGVDTVILAARWPANYPGGSTPYDDIDLEPALDARLTDLRHVREVVLLLPVPELRRAAPECIAMGRLQECAYPEATVRAAIADTVAMMNRLAARHPNVRLVDPLPFFCDGTTCPVMRDGYALFWDDNHVSTTAAREFAAWQAREGTTGAGEPEAETSRSPTPPAERRVAGD